MGDIAEAILEGVFDQYTGEYIDDTLSWTGGSGYPREHPDNVKLNYFRKTKKSPIYNTIKQLVSANSHALAQCKNRNATIAFLHKFYSSSNIPKRRSKNWKHYQEVTKEYKKEFKQFIKDYK